MEGQVDAPSRRHNLSGRDDSRVSSQTISAVGRVRGGKSQGERVRVCQEASVL